MYTGICGGKRTFPTKKPSKLHAFRFAQADRAAAGIIVFALKGQPVTTRGDAPGHGPVKTKSPEGAKQFKLKNITT